MSPRPKRKALTKKLFKNLNNRLSCNIFVLGELAVCVYSADIQDRRGARLLMIRLYAMFTALSVIWADGGYSGVLVKWANAMSNWNLIIVKRTDAMRGKFVALPRRWVVERSFAWLGNSRRLSKDYERLSDTAEVHRLLRGISEVFKQRFSRASDRSGQDQRLGDA